MIQKSHFWVYIQKDKAATQRNICMPRFTAVLFTITKRWKQSECPQQMNKQNVIYIGILLNIIKE